MDKIHHMRKKRKTIIDFIIKQLEAVPKLSSVNHRILENLLIFKFGCTRESAKKHITFGLEWIEQNE